MDREGIYIGDGVYVSFDGYQIWLAVNDHRNKVVALEPNVWRELLIAAPKLIYQFQQRNAGPVTEPPGTASPVSPGNLVGAPAPTLLNLDTLQFNEESK